MTFHVGQKVVCVNDRICVSCKFGWWRGYETLDHNLNRGEVYTVVEVQMIEDAAGKGTFQCLRLAEAIHFKKPEIGFPSFMFRPLIEKKLPAELTALLDEKNHQPLPEEQKRKRRKVSADLCGND